VCNSLQTSLLETTPGMSPSIQANASECLRAAGRARRFIRATFLPFRGGA